MRTQQSPLLKLEVPLIVLLGERRMRLGDVTALIPGSIIELHKPADDELEVLVNNKAIGTGVAVKVGENFGIRLTYVGDVRQRIKALGPSDADAPQMPAEILSVPEHAPAPASTLAGQPA